MLLGAVLLRLDRRWRAYYASQRARQAARFAAEHELYAAEHRSFTTHMLELLDAATDRIGVQRIMLDLLEADIAALRSARPAAAEPEPVARGPGHVVDVLGEVPEWTGSGPTGPKRRPSSISSSGTSGRNRAPSASQRRRSSSSRLDRAEAAMLGVEHALEFYGLRVYPLASASTDRRNAAQASTASARRENDRLCPAPRSSRHSTATSHRTRDADCRRGSPRHPCAEHDRARDRNDRPRRC